MRPRLPNWMCLPMGFSCGNWARAQASLISATRGVVAVSCTVNRRPRLSGIRNLEVIGRHRELVGPGCVRFVREGVLVDEEAESLGVVHVSRCT